MKEISEIPAKETHNDISIREAGTPTVTGLVACSPGDPPVEELFYMDCTCCFTTRVLKPVFLCRVLRMN